jgi:hypothetical protein
MNHQVVANTYEINLSDGEVKMKLSLGLTEHHTMKTQLLRITLNQRTQFHNDHFDCIPCL